MSGCDKPIAGMGSFAGQKVVHPLARRQVPSLDRIKICCEDKNGPPPVVRGRFTSALFRPDAQRDGERATFSSEHCSRSDNLQK